MNKILKDVKKNHLLMITNDIYIHENATMNELKQRLPLSQPSISNMIKILKEHHVIIELGNDLSSGGRCATRLTINKEQYHILNIYIRNHIIYYQINHFNEIEIAHSFPYTNEEDIIQVIIQLYAQYKPHCLVLAVEGYVQDDIYVTDHHNIIQRHDWIQTLKASIHTPIYLINDVKAMHLGRYFYHQKDHTIYLHINNVGIGSSYFYQDFPIYGSHGLMGEIGLIPLDGITINQRIREAHSQKEFNDILCFILSIIITMIDPNYIDISIDMNWQYDEESIKKYIQKYFHILDYHKIHLNMNFQKSLFQGLQYIGIKNLIKERVEKINVQV